MFMFSKYAFENGASSYQSLIESRSVSNCEGLLQIGKGTFGLKTSWPSTEHWIPPFISLLQVLHIRRLPMGVPLTWLTNSNCKELAVIFLSEMVSNIMPLGNDLVMNKIRWSWYGNRASPFKQSNLIWNIQGIDGLQNSKSPILTLHCVKYYHIKSTRIFGAEQLRRLDKGDWTFNIQWNTIFYFRFY